MARNSEHSLARAAFAALLAGHLAAGTRPATAAGEPWSYAEFAGNVPSSRDHAGDYVSPRSVSNWCKGTSLPDEIEPVLRALFGTGDRHAAYREELRAAFMAARAEKNAAIIGRARREPAGGRWVIENDERFVLDRTARPTDRRAASDPLRQQLQRAIRDRAAALRKGAARLANSRTWSRVPAAAGEFYAVVDGDPAAMPERLGEAYALLLQLGRFLETDARLRNDPGSSDNPLDPEIHGLLSDLVQLAAPWLRGFPTVGAWDDAAGRTLVRADLFRPAVEFTRIARDQQTIPERDAAELRLLAEAAHGTDFQGQKAGNRLVGDVWNLLLATATLRAAAGAGGRVTPEPPLLRRASATLAAAKHEIDQLAASRPDDLRRALNALLEEGDSAAAGPGLAPGVIPADVEKQARDMILRGEPVPAAWRPAIRTLHFSGTDLQRLDLLADLAGLQTLDFGNTQVADLSPLAGLSGLRVLFLANTSVANLAPLAGLSGLQRLNFNRTQVADLSPLAELSRLRDLSFNSTQVADLSPLAGLSRLESLYFGDTRVVALSPVAGLSWLRNLFFNGTAVADLSPLAGLSRLESLAFFGTQAVDLSPLAGLSGLQSLSFERTPVADLSPLAGLSGLYDLYFDRTPVADLSRLAGLSRLRILYFDETPVADLSPLAGLSWLRVLSFDGTPVADLAPLAGLSGLQELYLGGTHVADLRPLAGLAQLKTLHLHERQRLDLSPLTKLKGLQIIREPRPDDDQAQGL